MDKERSKGGTYLPAYDKALVVVSVKVKQEMADRLNALPDKSQFMRDALDYALSQLNKQLL